MSLENTTLGDKSNEKVSQEEKKNNLNKAESIRGTFNELKNNFKINVVKYLMPTYFIEYVCKMILIIEVNKIIEMSKVCIILNIILLTASLLVKTRIGWQVCLISLCSIIIIFFTIINCKKKLKKVKKNIELNKPSIKKKSLDLKAVVPSEGVLKYLSGGNLDGNESDN